MHVAQLPLSGVQRLPHAYFILNHAVYMYATLNFGILAVVLCDLHGAELRQLSLILGVTHLTTLRALRHNRQSK